MTLIQTLLKPLYIFKRKKFPKKINKILVFKIGALGDVVMLTPFLRELRKNFPNKRIDFLIGNYAKPVLENNPNIDEIISFDQNLVFNKNIKELLNLAKRIKKRKYDVCFVLDKAWQFGVLSSMFGCFRIGFDRLGEGFANNISVPYNYTIKHETNYYLDVLDAMGLNVSKVDKTPEIYLVKQDEDFAEKLFQKNNLENKKVIGVVPGGANNPAVGIDFIRRLNPDKFIEFIKIISKKHPVVLLGAMSDSDFNNEIIKKVGAKNVFNFPTKLVQQSVAIMKRCSWVVANDSGPMHFAAASGTKVLSLFGPTDPKRKAPLTKGSVSIWKDEDIYEPDYEVYGTKPKTKDFFSRIKVEDLVNVILPDCKDKK